MNVPPTDGIRVPPQRLREFVEAIFLRAAVPAEHARLIAQLLVDTDLRGVVSHGVANVDRYVRSYQRNRTNRLPQIRILKEGPTTAALCGDGGLGIVVGTQAMQLAIAKAREMGVGVATSTYHAHIGSAGKYVRMALAKNLVGITFSGRSSAPQYDYSATILRSIQGSPPLAFGFPAGGGKPAYLLDTGSKIPWDEACFRKTPEIYIKAVGLSHVANILSGVLGGQMLPEFDRRTLAYPDADQSAFYLAVDIERFVPTEAFTSDIDRLMEEAGKMAPLPGLSESSLPGYRAWRKEREYAIDGIPISAANVDSLERLARELDVTTPWET